MCGFFHVISFSVTKRGQTLWLLPPIPIRRRTAFVGTYLSERCAPSQARHCPCVRHTDCDSRGAKESRPAVCVQDRQLFGQAQRATQDTLFLATAPTDLGPRERGRAVGRYSRSGGEYRLHRAGLAAPPVGDVNPILLDELVHVARVFDDFRRQAKRSRHFAIAQRASFFHNLTMRSKRSLWRGWRATFVRG